MGLDHRAQLDAFQARAQAEHGAGAVLVAQVGGEAFQSGGQLQVLDLQRRGGGGQGDAGRGGGQGQVGEDLLGCTVLLG
ncbi:hypothetical protein D9M70_538150 [compost metagenome]